MKHCLIGILVAILLLSPRIGFSETPSPKKIAEWRKAAAQGNAEAQYYLGAMYQVGAGVNKDDTEAAKWYKLAAEQGLPAAQSNLVSCHACKGV